MFAAWLMVAYAIVGSVFGAIVFLSGAMILGEVDQAKLAALSIIAGAGGVVALSMVHLASRVTIRSGSWSISWEFPKQGKETPGTPGPGEDERAGQDD